MMLGENHLGALAIGDQGLVQIARPFARIAYLCPPDGQHVVHRVGRVFRHAQRLGVREVQVHFRWRFGAWRQLEFDPHAIDDALFHCLPLRADQVGGRDQRHRAQRGGLAQPGANLAVCTFRQQRAVHVKRTPAHRGAGIDVLGDGVFQKSGRRIDFRAAGLHIRIAGDTLHPAVMIHMRVGIDDRHHRFAVDMFVIQRQSGGSGFHADQGIDDDQAGVTFHDRHVGKIEAADLMDAGGHFEQSGDVVEPLLPPEAGIDGIGRRLAAHEGVIAGHVPDDIALRISDPIAGQAGDQAALGGAEIGTFGKGQLAQHRGIGHARGRLGGFRTGRACGHHAGAAGDHQRRTCGKQKLSDHVALLVSVHQFRGHGKPDATGPGGFTLPPVDASIRCAHAGT